MPASKSRTEQAEQSLRERLGGESQLQEFLAYQAELRAHKEKRISDLQSDKVFLTQTEQLKDELKKAHGFDSTATESFLSRFPIPGPHNFQDALKFVESLPNHVQDALRAYIRYASTHGVYFVRRKGLFEWKVAPSSIARKFLAKLVDGRLDPVVAMPADDEGAHYFEVPGLPVWPAVQDLIDESTTQQGENKKDDEKIEIKFIEIQDTTGNSVLNDIEFIAPEVDGVTIILHRAERPYLVVMFGENVKKKPLQKLGKVVSAFQDEYERGRAGRPTDIQTLKNTIAAVAKGGPLKDMELEPAPLPEDKAKIEQVNNPLRSETQTGPSTAMEQKPASRTEGEKARAKQAKRMSRLRKGFRKPLPQP